MITIYTIGFSGKDARKFFTTLKENNISLLVDIRLNNVSQLSGYTKKNDLEYFLSEICKINYIHEPLFAPTKEILDSYKKNIISWQQYIGEYIPLITKRKIIENSKIDFNNSCLLCSEKSSEECHRGLLANMLREMRMVDKIVHL